VNLKQAFAQATPGELWMDDDHFIASGHGDDYKTIADPRCMEPTADTMKEMDANAVLLIHCFNHFQEVVNELQKLRDHIVSDVDGACGVECDFIKDADETLARAQEVKP
jgi:hypothetical protein